MRQRVLTVAVAALAALVTVTACSGSGNQATSPSSTTSAGAPAASGSASADQQHNQADVTFAQNMIPHHQQAIQMSDIILGKQGIDPRVIQLANDIKAAQGPEIQQMQGWLRQWGVPTMSMAPGMTMSGMLPDHAMTALQDAQGADASRQFLTGMIQHHQGAIAMAQDEIKSGQYPPAITLAQSIVTSQQQQITTMRGLLASL
ncbi:DUF305 domain-containing protein [Mycobacterium sp.]|uniref:DUF305 domain-containing protein n=1 Tax=Mycobacterium sp. TaxID=1785 RepID=UPI002D6273A5|nr:DUF305 domain-containing protein [Mycobacterium sp.]HZA09071.1 DUF305 domain-containing protein [Mycobacterium sp.]